MTVRDAAVWAGLLNGTGEALFKQLFGYQAKVRVDESVGGGTFSYEGAQSAHNHATEDRASIKRKPPETALITGGTSGIGRAVANKLAQLGIHVVVVGRNEERGERTVADLNSNHRNYRC